MIDFDAKPPTLIGARNGGGLPFTLLSAAIGLMAAAYGIFSLFRPDRLRRSFEAQRQFWIRLLPFTRNWESPMTDARARVFAVFYAVFGVLFFIAAVIAR